MLAMRHGRSSRTDWMIAPQTRPPHWMRDSSATMVSAASASLGNYSLLSRDALPPPVRRGNVVVGCPLLARAAVKVLPVGAAGHGVLVPEEAALPQLGQQQLRDLLERPGEEDVALVMCVSRRACSEKKCSDATYKVEAVDVGLFDPRLQAVGDLLWRADDDGPVAAEADVLGNGVLCPL